MNAVAALLVAVCVAVVSAVVLAFAGSGLTPTIAWLALGAGLAAGAWQSRACFCKKESAPAKKLGVWEWLTIVAFALFSLRAFCWLVFYDDDKIKILSPNNLGDLALHLAYIRNLANGVPFWPENPIFAGVKIHYPLGVDVFNSLLTLVGVDVWRGLIWTGLAGCAVAGIALWRWGGGFALAGFLFNGGLTDFAIFKSKDFRWGDLGGALLKDLNRGDADLAWKNIPLTMFVTQRGLLYAIPAGLLLLCSWRARFFPDEKNAGEKPPLPFWGEVLLYSTMPLFHLHTFLFLSMLLGCWLCTGPRRREIAVLIACSVVPATTLIVWVTGMFGSRSMVHLKAGWMQGADGFLHFWFTNFGVLPLLVAALCALLAWQWRTQRRAAAFVFPSVAIFILCCFVMFAPWEWDNTKIMIWPYLAVLPFLWERLLAGRAVWIRAVACAVLFFYGFVSLFGGIDGSHTGYELADRSEVDGVATAVKQLPATAIFAAAPAYNHPLLLNGRKVVAGYLGHLWSHGIDYKHQIERLSALLKGRPDWREAARELRVRYVFWGEPERNDYADSRQPWKKECPLVASGDWGEIYDLEKPEPPAKR
jgi:hypothetical protein